MITKWMMGVGACALAACLLSGCVAPTNVKDVQADPWAYLRQNFSPDKLPGQVKKTVSNMDGGSLGFQRMVLHTTWTVNEDDKNKTMKVGQVLTLSNAGGNLVESLSENSRNGMPIGQLFQLSYRNLVWLRAQGMNPSASFAPMRREVKQFERFDSVAAGSGVGQLDYTFKTGTDVQLLNFQDGRVTCARGEFYPASRVFASFAGEAQNIECSDYNANGVLQNKFRYAYLRKYGVAIAVHSELASGISDVTIQSVTIQ